MYDDQNNHSKVAFFFGAGASVDAGLYDVVKLVSELKQWLGSDSQAGYRLIVDAILNDLRRFKHETEDETDIDIELLLETVEKIENRYNDVLQYFCDNKKLRLETHRDYSSVFGGNIKLSTKIRLFIKDLFSRTQLSTEYLSPLKDFITQYRPLSIFSTNYDVCVESFCNDNGKNWTDGFNPYWNPHLEYRREDVDVKLYKLHGSVLKLEIICGVMS